MITQGDPENDFNSPGSSLKLGNALHFDVSFTASENKQKKIILNKVSDVIQSGEMLAIMGPSGAGKTTLLRVLTMEAFGGIGVGVVKLNGQTMTSSLFKEKCGIVAQEDYHWAFLTCRETIAYATDLLLPHLTIEEKRLKVDRMIRKMGLESCRDTIVGNQFVHGLSGGQKRRLSLAVALMKQVEVIFLDEPTSGLDAAAASGIMIFLSEVTKREKIITIFTVHQPSTTTFNKFDRVLLLSRGRIAYCGFAKNVQDYLRLINHPLPQNMNPAEYLLDIVNMDFTDKQHVMKILDDWETCGKPDHDTRIKAILTYQNKVSMADINIPMPTTYEKKFLSHTLIMLHRHLLLSLRDPMVYSGRVVLFFVCTIFFAVVYIKARVRNQEQALNREWFSNWCIGVPSNMSVIAVYVFSIELLAIKREVKNGMVNPISYLLANSVLQIPVMFLFGLAVLPLPAYVMMDFQRAHFIQMWLIFSLTMYAFEAVAQLLAVSFSNPLIGMLLYISLWFNSFLFSGLFLPIQYIVWPFRIFGYVMPFRYAFQLLAYEEFTGTTFHGAEPCTYMKDTGCLYGGYKCTDTSGICYGYTGKQVLSNLHKTFSVYSSSDNVGTSVASLFAIAITAKLGFIIMMSIRTREESKLLSIEKNRSNSSIRLGIFTVASIRDVSPLE